MRRKVRNWAAFLLALALVLGMIPAAYAAGYSITVNAKDASNTTTKAVTINVTDVNEAPNITRACSEPCQ